MSACGRKQASSQYALPWTGLRHKSEAFSVLKRTERSKEELGRFSVMPADVKVNDMADQLFGSLKSPNPLFLIFNNRLNFLKKLLRTLGFGLGSIEFTLVL